MMNTNIEGMAEVPLSVSNLKVYFLTQEGVSKVITRLNFSLRESEILGIFGESGSGKTVVSNSIIDLLMEPGYVVGGSVRINGFNIYRDVKSLAKFEASIASGKKRKTGETLIREQERIMQKIRDHSITLVPENAFRSLNPALKLKDHMVYTVLSRNAAGICSSIIKREKASLQDVEALIELVQQQPDIAGRNRLIGIWLTENAIFNNRSLIFNVFENSTDQENLHEQIFDIISKEKKGTDVSEIENVRNTLLLELQKNKLSLDIIMANDEKDTELKADLERELQSIELKLKSSTSPKDLVRSILNSTKYEHIREVALSYCYQVLRELGIDDPEKIADLYPDDVPVVIRQKMVIAMAFSVDSGIIVLDEPASNYDVNTKLKILSFIREQHRRKKELSIVIFSKDLTVLNSISDRLLVMYAGNIVEEGTPETIVSDSKHPFTSSVINTFSAAERVTEKSDKLEFTLGFSPDLTDPPKGCRFHPRCKFRMDICSLKKPLLAPLTEGHNVACFLYSEQVEED